MHHMGRRLYGRVCMPSPGLAAWGWDANPRGAVVIPCPLVDTFTGPNGQTLAAHAPDVNEFAGPWTARGPAPLPSGDIQTNRARITDAGDGQGRAFTIECGISDALIVATFYGNAINPAWGGLSFRDDGTDYWVLRQNAEGDQAQLFNPLGALVDSDPLVSGANHEILFTLTINGTSISGVVRNVTTGNEVTLTATSALNQAATKHGLSIRTAFGAGANDRFDDFSVCRL